MHDLRGKHMALVCLWREKAWREDVTAPPPNSPNANAKHTLFLFVDSPTFCYPLVIIISPYDLTLLWLLH